MYGRIRQPTGDKLHLDKIIQHNPSSRTAGMSEEIMHAPCTVSVEINSHTVGKQYVEMEMHSGMSSGMSVFHVEQQVEHL